MATYYAFTFHNHYDGSAATNFTINDQSARILMGMRGFGAGAVSIPMTRGPYTDGAVVVGSPFTTWPPPLAVDWPTAMPYTAPRQMEIALRLNYTSISALQAGYAALLRGVTPYAPVFQGDTSYLSIVLPDGTTTRIIECYCTGVSDMEIKGRTNAMVTLSFLAPSPFFHQAWGAAGASTSWSTGTNPVTINNPGDAPFWPVIKIMGSAAGVVDNIHITNNTTGKIWSTSQDMSTGADRYITAYMDRAQMDYYNGATNTSIIGKLDTDAEFWPLIIGDNALQWSTTAGTPSAITVYHMWYYLGI